MPDLPDGDDRQEHEGAGLTLFYVRPALRARIAEIAREALDAPARCPHIPAPLISAVRPRDGSWCASCGAGHVARLLGDPLCSLCRHRRALPGLRQLPAGEHDVLTRICRGCLERPAPPDSPETPDDQ